MTEHELIYTLTIAAEKTISGAARTLFISQPSLSQTLNGIEQEFGRLLFNRTPDGLIPTEFGCRYLTAARQILARRRLLLAELEEFQNLKKGLVSLGIPANLGTYLLPGILPRFQSLYPGITVQFQEANSSELYQLLLTGKTAFNIMHYDGPHQAIRHEHLAYDPFYLVIPESYTARYQLPADHKLTAGELKRLNHEPFVMVARQQKLRTVADSIIKKADITPDIRFETKVLETCKRLVARGTGITFLPVSYLNLFSSIDGLCCYALDDTLEANWELVVVYAERNPPSRCCQEFIRILKKVIHEADHI